MKGVCVIAFLVLLVCAASLAAPKEDPNDYCKTIQCPAVVYRVYPSPLSKCWYCVCYWGHVTPVKCDDGSGYDPSIEGCSPNSEC